MEKDVVVRIEGECKVHLGPEQITQMIEGLDEERLREVFELLLSGKWRPDYEDESVTEHSSVEGLLWMLSEERIRFPELLGLMSLAMNATAKLHDLQEQARVLARMYGESEEDNE